MENLPIRRNTLLLSASLAMNSGMLQLSAAIATITFVFVSGFEGLVGLGPAIVLGSGALAAQASFGVMVGLMTLTGSVVVDHHGHAGHLVFPIIGAHVIGMYALVLVVGDVIDRIGRPPALVGGLLLMAVPAGSLLWIESVPATAVAPFGP